ALGQLQVGGVPTTVPAAMAVLDHPDFASGDFTTRWLEESVELPESGEDYQPPSREDVEILGRYVWIPVIAGSTHASPGEPPVSDGSPSSSKKPSSRRPGKKSNSAVADGVVKAPMQGTIVRANVQPGDAVTAGDVLFVLEAMKMENPMVAPFDGTVSEVHVELGASVAAGTLVALVVESGT
ncbi:MAG: biotin/lipoyl-containing protein, partial [Aquiluna sp.]